MRQWTALSPGSGGSLRSWVDVDGDDLADGEERVWRKGDARRSGLDYGIWLLQELQGCHSPRLNRLTRVVLRLPQHAIRCQASVVTIPGGRK